MITRRSLLKSVAAGALGFCAGLPVQVFAQNEVEAEEADMKLTETELEQALQLEVETRLSDIYEDVYKQLEEQGQEAMFVHYEEAIAALLQQEVLSEYGYGLTSTRSTSYYFPYGGVLTYTNSLSATVAITYMDEGCTSYYMSKSGSIVADTIISLLLGAIPSWGNVFSTLIALSTAKTTTSKASVEKAGGIGYIMSVASGADTSTVLLGWSSSPYGAVPDGSTGISYSRFPSSGHTHG